MMWASTWLLLILLAAWIALPAASLCVSGRRGEGWIYLFIVPVVGLPIYGIVLLVEYVLRT